MPDQPIELLAETPPHSSNGLRIAHAIPSAFSALLANKGRSLLTALGIIGVAAVMAIVAPGARARVHRSLRNLWTRHQGADGQSGQ